jgi:hypothetical protein
LSSEKPFCGASVSVDGVPLQLKLPKNYVGKFLGTERALQKN